MDFIKRILHQAVVFILIFNIAVFGFMAWPEGYTAVDLAHSGMPVVVRAAEDAVTHGEIYRLDRDAPAVQAIIRLDIQLYEQANGRLVTVHPDWKTYVITGDLAQKISNDRGVFAFTDVLNHIVIFLAVGGVDPMLTVAHEYTHVIQTEDSMRIMRISRISAEYEAEVTARSTVGLLLGLALPAAYPLHRISVVENLQVLKYLAETGE